MNKTNGEDAVNPQVLPLPGKLGNTEVKIFQTGLTKREWFAGQIMAAVMADDAEETTEVAAARAAYAADKLIDALNQTGMPLNDPPPQSKSPLSLA